MMVGIGAASPPCTSSRPSWPFRRLTRAHEELATYIDGWESKRPSTTPASTCSDAALTRTVAFRSAFPNLHARARADLMTFRNLADASIGFGRSDGRTQDMGVGDAVPRAFRHFPRLAPRRGASARFRRLTTADEGLATYIDGSAVSGRPRLPPRPRMG